MNLTAHLLSLLNAAASLFGGGSSAAMRFLRALVRSLGVSSQYGSAFGVAAQAAVPNNTKFAFGVILPGTEIPIATNGNITIAEPGDYAISAGIIATGLVGGVAWQVYRNATADGVAFTSNLGALPGVPVIGTTIVRVSAADITAGGILTLRNVSGAALTLPLNGAGPFAGGSANIWVVIRRLPNLSA